MFNTGIIFNKKMTKKPREYRVTLIKTFIINIKVDNPKQAEEKALSLMRSREEDFYVDTQVILTERSEEC